VVDFGGSGATPLLLVHGSFGHARVWDPLVAALPADVRVVAVDLPGNGDSPWRSNPAQYAMDSLVEELRCVVAGLSAPPVLAGHSVGGAVVMHAAARYRHLLAGVAILDIDPCPPPSQSDHVNQAGSAPLRRYGSFERALARESRIAPGASAAVHEHLARHGYRLEGGEYVQKFDQAFLRAVRTWDARPLLASITTPALVLRGAHSTVMSRAGFDDLLAGLSDVRGVVIPDASHQLHLDNPWAVASSLLEFIREIEALEPRAG
jgi:pimeloyl-ACP methyl ester carboxylesterase